jgi:hypothetical protein
LDIIVADSAGGPHSFIDVARFEHALVLHVARKDSSKEVSLQFQSHGQLISLNLIHPALHCIDAIRNPEKLLYVMTVAPRKTTPILDVRALSFTSPTHSPFPSVFLCAKISKAVCRSNDSLVIF